MADKPTKLSDLGGLVPSLPSVHTARTQPGLNTLADLMLELKELQLQSAVVNQHIDDRIAQIQTFLETDVEKQGARRILWELMLDLKESQIQSIDLNSKIEAKLAAVQAYIDSQDQ